jgi:hypothetical protein
MPKLPRHGQQRNRRQELSEGDMREFVGSNIGRFSMPTSLVSTPVSERWCGTCGAWQEQRGILASILGCPACGSDWDA